MDTIQDMAAKYDLKDELIKPQMIIKVLKNIPNRNHGLRWFCAQHLVFVYLQRWREDPDDDESENDYDEDEDDEDEDSLDKMLYVKRTDAKSLFRI
jgi:hypothetical protein